MHGKPWQYVFYADYQLSTPNSADAALELLARHCSMVKELGRYRSGDRGKAEGINLAMKLPMNSGSGTGLHRIRRRILRVETGLSADARNERS